MSTVTARTARGSATSVGLRFRPRANSASDTSPAATRPRQRVVSTRVPAYPSSAGSSVNEAIIVTVTTVAAPTPNPETNATPINNMPSSEITTVIPAKVTARPEVSIAMAMDSSTE